MVVESYGGCFSTSGGGKNIVNLSNESFSFVNTLAYVWQHLKGISDILEQQYLIIAFQRVHI